MANVVVDPNGFWNLKNVERGVVNIPSNRITMKGVDFPVLGISDTGDTKVMYPNGEYKFNGNNVTEYKMKNGGKNSEKQTSFDVMNNFVNKVLSPTYATQAENSKVEFQDGGVNDFWTQFKDQKRAFTTYQTREPQESDMFVNYKDIVSANDMAQKIFNEYEPKQREDGTWYDTEGEYEDIDELYNKHGLDLSKQDLRRFSLGEDNVNNISTAYENADKIDSYWGMTDKLMPQTGFEFKPASMVKGWVDNETVIPQPEKYDEKVSVNWQNLDDNLRFVINAVTNAKEYVNTQKQEKELNHLNDSVNQFFAHTADRGEGDFAFNVQGVNKGFDQTEIQHNAMYGGRKFQKGGMYNNVTPEELKYLAKNGFKFKIL